VAEGGWLGTARQAINAQQNTSNPASRNGAPGSAMGAPGAAKRANNSDMIGGDTIAASPARLATAP
jgi:hypothetical protein